MSVYISMSLSIFCLNYSSLEREREREKMSLGFIIRNFDKSTFLKSIFRVFFYVNQGYLREKVPFPPLNVCFMFSTNGSLQERLFREWLSLHSLVEKLWNMKHATKHRGAVIFELKHMPLLVTDVRAWETGMTTKTFPPDINHAKWLCLLA